VLIVVVFTVVFLRVIGLFVKSVCSGSGLSAGVLRAQKRAVGSG